jgi:hypothetical protein
VTTTPDEKAGQGAAQADALKRAQTASTLATSARLRPGRRHLFQNVAGRLTWAVCFSKAKVPDPPPIIPPAPMPDKEGPAIREAQRRAAEEAMGRAGRASTIMTDDQDATAGNGGNTDSYGGKTLGGG